MRCYTCGTETQGYAFTCPVCATNDRLASLRDEISGAAWEQSSALARLQASQERGLGALRDVMMAGFVGLATALEWGFSELSWRAQQQTAVLADISRTLRTPSETQANEWREMGETLRQRGLHDESVEFYAKSLDANRLDYRAHVGLAETYIQWSKFDEAEAALRRSLPHAPHGEIDYKSYSYRMLGHIAWCRGDNPEAFQFLEMACELSPDYTEALYDLAQYAVLVGRMQRWEAALRKAVTAKPGYWYLAKSERNFDPARSEVDAVLEAMKPPLRALVARDQVIAQAESGAVHDAVGAVAQVARAIGPMQPYGSQAVLDAAERDMEKVARESVAQDDYLGLLDCVRRASAALDAIRQVVPLAENERKSLESALARQTAAQAAQAAQRARDEAAAEARQAALVAQKARDEAALEAQRAAEAAQQARAQALLDAQAARNEVARQAALEARQRREQEERDRRQAEILPSAAKAFFFGGLAGAPAGWVLIQVFAIAAGWQYVGDESARFVFACAGWGAAIGAVGATIASLRKSLS